MSLLAGTHLGAQIAPESGTETPYAQLGPNFFHDWGSYPGAQEEIYIHSNFLIWFWANRKFWIILSYLNIVCKKVQIFIGSEVHSSQG